MTGKDQTTQNQTTDQTQTQNQPQPQAQPASKQQTQEPQDTPAPRYHASESLTWFQQRQQQQTKDKVDPGVPDSAKPVNIADSKFVALPAGGIAALADSLYPDDKDDAEKMHQHVFDLYVANRDVLRDDTSSTVGTMVRIP